MRALGGRAAQLALLWCCLIAATRVLNAQAPASPQPVAQEPVIVDGKFLFPVQGVLSFTAQARAAAITKRIDDLGDSLRVKPESITVSDAEGTSDIVAGDLVLMSVTDRDAQLAGHTRQQVARDYAGRIGNALTTMQREHSARSLTLGAAYALAATLVLALVLRLLAWLYRKLYAKIEQWRATAPAIRIQRFELLTADRIADLVAGLARITRLVLTLALLYGYASLVLGFFPWTRGYARVLVADVLSPLGSVGDAIVAYLPNLFFVGIIVLVAVYVTKFIRMIFGEIGKQTIEFPGFHPEWAEPTFKLVRFLIVALTLVALFPYLPGAKSPAFQGVSLFLGVLVSLGSSSAVANIVAGIILTYMRAFRIGDRVQIADTVGDVMEQSLLVTRIRTIKNVEITIANSMVLSSHIVNFSASCRQEGLILHTEVTIGYDAPWRQIHELLLAAAAETGNLLATPKPFILQTALDDFYVHYQLNAYTDQPGVMARTYSDLHAKIQDKFNEAGVEIMSPHYATMREGNHIAIPESYLGKDYVAPRFRVDVEKR